MTAVYDLEDIDEFEFLQKDDSLEGKACLGEYQVWRTDGYQ